MASVQPRFGGPGFRVSYTPNAVITGGQLVERVAGTRLVQPAGAGSLIACGVALWDVPAARASIQGPQVGDVNGLAVVRRVVILVTYAAAATEGQKLVAAANGQVTPAGAAPDARTVVGECFDATGLGATGLALIY
jgi:hypothetical protein